MSTIDLLSASAFTYQELTEAYNRTRVDYLVPMPMNASKLREYVIMYDIDMQASVVAVDGYGVLGLCMLGVRADRAWISRLGVIQSNRRGGTGGAMVDQLLDESRRRNLRYVIIEVIKNNAPAYNLFVKRGFQETRELLVIGRPPSPPKITPPKAQIKSVPYQQTLELIKQRQAKPTWVEEVESVAHSGNIEAFSATLPDGSSGWIVYQNTIFQISRIAIQTESGDPVKVGIALLHHLHREYGKKDTKTENLPADDPHWPAFKELGYYEMFRRHELILYL